MKCTHLHNIVQLSLVELCKLKKDESCTDCETNGPNLWICLQKNCLHIGCSEQYKDHSTIHFQSNRTHCIHMNLSSQRVWCYLCESELFLTKHLHPQQIQQQQQQQHHHHYHHRRTSVVSNDSSDTSRYSSVNNDKLIVHADKLVSGASVVAQPGASGYGGDSCDSSGEEDDFERHGKWNGLVGLQNLANTCYMNAALQALSNSPPLTGYFLDCGAILETDLLGGTNPAVTKPGLAKHYHKLIREMWCKNRRYVVPSGILCGIRIVHPMFRGYQQHDTQEFLRCFMDQLHEELKEVTAPPPPDVLARALADELDERPSPCSSPSPSQSEGEYETCDSGVSERSSLSDDQLSPTKQRTTGERFRLLSARSSSPTEGEMSSLVTNQRIVASPRSRTSSIRQQSPVGSARSNVSSVSSASVSGAGTGSPGGVGGGGGGTAAGGGGGGGDPTDSGAGTAKEKLPQRSIISDIFDGKLLSSVQCLTCDRVSTREETFQDLSLPIPGKDHLAVLHQTQGMGSSSSSSSGSSVSGGVVSNAANSSGSGGTVGSGSSGSGGGGGGVTCSDAVYPVNGDSWLWWFWNSPIWSWVRSWFWGPAVTLHDCMAAFFSADELKGDNMYSCERCNKLRNGVKYSRVLALPEMLCVHLKRFRHDLSYSSKISSPVHFPLYGLDMRPYLHKDCKSEVTSYDLCAVICHHGTVGGGHYTSFAKHDPTGKWFEFDDQLVTQVTPEHVQSCEAYVLFYRKNNAKMATVRAQASNLLTMQEHASDIRFYVSRNWLHRFNTFAEPGPIDNWTLLCPHGAFPPNKASHFSKLVVPFPQALWDFLYKKFGGGPVCNHIFPCHICKKAAETLSRRQRYELETFTAYNDDFQFNDTPTTIYAISMAWFRQWQLFARGLTTDDPGPIQNRSIAIQGDNSVPLRSVRPFSDYAQINANLWHFFHGIYGGGPEIVLQGNPVPAPVPTHHQQQQQQQQDEHVKQQQKMPKERTSESMEVIEEAYSPSETRSATVAKQLDRDSAIEVTITESPPPQQPMIPSTIVNPTVLSSAGPPAIRPQKSVSFEDNDAYHHDDDSSIDEEDAMNVANDDGHSSPKQQQSSAIAANSHTNSFKRKSHTKASSRRHEAVSKTSAIPSEAGHKRKQHQSGGKQHQPPEIATQTMLNGDGGSLGVTTTTAVSAALHGVEHLEIGSKKDRRHKTGMMRANGFFGPEGKYQSSSADYSNGGTSAGDSNTLTRTESLSFQPISAVGTGMNGRTTITSSYSEPTFAGQQAGDTMNASNMSVDEVTPLLTQSTTIASDATSNSSHLVTHEELEEESESKMFGGSNSSSSSLHQVPPIGTSNNSAKSSSHRSKGHHRHGAHAGVIGTDDASTGLGSEKLSGGMSFGRRKLKMKYMKKLASRTAAGVSGGRGRNGTLVDGGEIGHTDEGTVVPLALNGIAGGEHGASAGESVK